MDWMGSLGSVLVVIWGVRWQLEMAGLAWVGSSERLGRHGFDALGMYLMAYIWRRWAGGAAHWMDRLE